MRRWRRTIHACRRETQYAALDAALSMQFNESDAMLFKTTFPKTPSGKIELQSAYLERTYSAPLPTFRPVGVAYPLTLISPASDKRTTSTFGGCAIAMRSGSTCTHTMRLYDGSPTG